MDYLNIKWLHILSAALLYGACWACTIWMLCARKFETASQYLLYGLIERTHLYLLLPCLLLHPVTGYLLVVQAEFDMTSLWISLGFTLHVLVLFAWVRLHMVLRRMQHALLSGTGHYLLTIGIILVCLTFTYWVMVTRPVWE